MDAKQTAAFVRKGHPMFVLLFLLLATPLLLFLLPLYLPRRWLPACALFVGYAAIAIGVNAARAQCASCGSFGDALGWGLYMLGCLGFSAGWLIRIGWSSYRKTGAPVHSRLSLAAGDALSAFGCALLALWFTVTATRSLLDDGLAVHATVLLLALLWFPVFNWYAAVRIRAARAWPRLFAAIGSATLLAAVAWSVQVAPRALAAADRAAAGAAYCVETSSPVGFRPARDRLDMSGFLMRDGPVVERHALLAIDVEPEPRWAYWSYRKSLFVDESRGNPQRCNPDRAYAAKLRWSRAWN
jgi:hypothetical protein